MMDTALDLVDVQGVSEDDPRIQRLEDKCGRKSASRYEIQSGRCDTCNASIAAVGMQAWLTAKALRDVDDENRFHAEMELQDAVAAALKQNRTFPDDAVDNFHSPSAQDDRPTGPQAQEDAMDIVDENNDVENSEDLGAALLAVGASRVDPDKLDDSEDIYDANDENGDNRLSEIVCNTNDRVSRSQAPSPSRGYNS